ncbi:uncharacterized protein LOC5573393 isoform X1 [Aedes aegypti]|uniref:Uncharacterized protein n=1 Tax=Aedes aegypti TaxID=7159 RepID=A0A6I8T5V8_AEDAE|nr:uncharacterized protein LOC5573393 isoform X1 [Aedes aegypti]XP_021702054.1 uncharacterized protein LOC5573393 isoform X1 [Aedes aegypti]XP_021702055.1 uncharacterized protein LOC5573393 isoform X1 [Aedes aegypti]
MSNDSQSSEEECPIYFGTPTIGEVKEYLRRLQRMPMEQQANITSETSDDSFDIDDSFQAMIERKRQQMMDSKQLEDVTSSEEPTAASVRLSEVGGGGDASSKFRGNDSTFIEENDSMRKTTDESFEEMERLCSMNLSKLGVQQQHDEEEEAIRRILESSKGSKSSSGGEGTEQKNGSGDNTTALADETQLEDVEEPSCMWENTMHQAGPFAKAISPVKRMHMLRPSTIIEEATINETTTSVSKNTSLESYITAKQNLNGSDDCSIITESEVYRTAEESREDLSKVSTVDSTADSAVGFDATAGEQTRLEAKYVPGQLDGQDDGEDDDDVIILSSSDSEAEDAQNSVDSGNPDGGKMDTGSLFNNSDSLQEDSLCQEDDSIGEELPGSPILDAVPDHFNDTMEEMEFMMRQGMKILQQQKAQQQSMSEKSRQTPANVKNTLVVGSHATPVTPISPNRYLKPKQQTSSNAKQNLFSYSASNKPKSAQKPFSALSAGSNSCGTFKKPVSRFPLPKSAKKFDHVVSPIGEYIKKTPQTMLQARIFCPNRNLIDVLHNKNDNRDSVMSSKENLLHHQEVDPEGYSSSLPRKGVVSSRGAHVLDERNPVRIPGGEKMHKLLNNSPTLVVRHEGRLRYQRETQLTEDSVVDDSMADLSLASGDISVRVLKDVRRF